MPRINHVALKVTDLEKATKFYENVYGFRQVGTGRSREHISRHMTDGYIDLALMVYDSEDDAEAKMVGPGPAIHHFGIEVEDHEGFAEKVVANGGTILSKPGEIPIKYRAPDGTVAEIVPRGATKRCGSAAPQSSVSAAHHCSWRRRARLSTSSASRDGRSSCWRQRGRRQDWETRSRRLRAAAHRLPTSACRFSGRRRCA